MLGQKPRKTHGRAQLKPARPLQASQFERLQILSFRIAASRACQHLEPGAGAAIVAESIAHFRESCRRWLDPSLRARALRARTVAPKGNINLTFDDAVFPL